MLGNEEQTERGREGGGGRRVKDIFMSYFPSCTHMWRSRILGVWIMPAEGPICIVLRKMNNKREKSDEQRETEDRNRPRKTPGTENPLFKSTFLPRPTLRAFKTAASSLSH